MRDPKRIKIIIEKLKKLWKNNPDWRLGQLVINVLSEQDASSGFMMRPNEHEIFTKEDDDFEKKLDIAIKKWK